MKTRRSTSLAALIVVPTLFLGRVDRAAGSETLPPRETKPAPASFAEMWAGFDPRAEPLKTEILLQWQEEDVTLRIVRFRIGVFQGTTAKLAAIYGFPAKAADGAAQVPGLVQIHSGGQYADYKACLSNAKRGYATLSIAWAGRISAPGDRVSPAAVQLFWDGKTDDPNYRLTTDWGALAARRALTFLEQQPEVDPDRLGVYGHSMGGKLTVMTTTDPRVKAAAPSCGGISDRYHTGPLYRATIGDDVSLKQITCPIVFLGPANVLRQGDFRDFAGQALADWSNVRRLTLSPAEHLRPGRRESGQPRRVGANWNGPPPRFRDLRWQVRDASDHTCDGREPESPPDSEQASSADTGPQKRAASPYREAASQPNILFIAVDDLNDWIGCLGGHPQAKTPNIDRLAASGVLFTNAHCAAPACNPSRTAIMTGLAPHKSGVYSNRQNMREVLPEAELLPKYFSRHGYWSAGSGKILHYFIDAPSWDEYFPAKETEDPFPRTLYPEKRPVSLPRGGPWQYVETDWGPLDATDQEYGGDWLVSKWVGEQLAREHDSPFFLACGIYRPHEPWFVPQKYFDLFPLEGIQLPPGYREDDLDDLPPAGKRLGPNRYFAHIRAHGQWKAAIQGYLASIAFADAMVGRVMESLENGPHRDNTIVVLWSDHGWHLGEKQHWQKFTAWRVCTRVPLIARVPAGTPGLPQGTQAGAVCSRPVNLLSLFPTLTDLAGLPAKDDNDGPSLVPLLANPRAEWPHASTTFLGEPGSFGLSTDTWRLIHYANGDEELYETPEDRYEWRNLAPDPAQADRLAELRKLGPTEFAPLIPASVESLTKLPWHPAPDNTAPASKPDGNPFDVFFINRGAQTVKLFWMDRQGQPRLYAEIAAGERKRQQTRPGAVWLITDSHDTPLGHFVVDDRTAQAVIPAK